MSLTIIPSLNRSSIDTILTSLIVTLPYCRYLHSRKEHAHLQTRPFKEPYNVQSTRPNTTGSIDPFHKRPPIRSNCSGVLPALPLSRPVSPDATGTYSVILLFFLLFFCDLRLFLIHLLLPACLPACLPAFNQATMQDSLHQTHTTINQSTTLQVSSGPWRSCSNRGSGPRP
jgi:hypothetical protein